MAQVLQSQQQPELVSREQVLFDRQVRLWGPHGQRKLRHTNVLALGSSVTITEALKGVILPSVESFTIVDDEIVTQYNISNNFFLTAKDLNKPISQCLVSSLGELNTSCRGVAISDPIADYTIRLLINTLYQLHHPAPQHVIPTESTMSSQPSSELTPDEYHSRLINWLKTQSESGLICSTVQDLLGAASPLPTKPIPGLPPHLQPKPVSKPQTTSLFDFTMILIDPTRLPISLQTTLSILTTAFNIPVLSMGSYSTMSMVKTTYPQRCVIETHFTTHNGAINLYLNRFQLKRFPQLVELATSDEFSYLDLQPPQDSGSIEYIDGKAKRSKVPYNLIMIRHALQFAAQHNKPMDKLDGGDNESLKQFIRAKKWRDEDSYTEAFTHCRYITGNLFHIQHMSNVVNNPLITANGTSFSIPNQERTLQIPTTTTASPPSDMTFFNLDGLIGQVKLFQQCIGVTPAQVESNTHLVDRHALYGDYNHPFWLLVAALRLFILNFPIARALGTDYTAAKNTIQPFLAQGVDFDHLVTHFTKLSADLAAADSSSSSGTTHAAFGCFPLNPSLPDMPASTELYGQIKSLYKSQFELDCGLFLIYLRYVLDQYAVQRCAVLSSTPDNSTTWFTSLENFTRSLQSILHVENPVNHFVFNSRQLRVNQAATSFGYLSTDYQDVFQHLSSASSASSASSTTEDSTNSSSDASQPLVLQTSTDAPTMDKTDNTWLKPTSFWDLLTPDFITKHPASSSFANTYDTTALNRLVSTPTSQRRIDSARDRIQSSLSEGVHPYLVDFYCSALALYEFQYNSHRYPSISTSLSNITIKLSRDLYSVSKPLSKLLHLDSMELSSIPQSIPPPSTTMHNEPTENELVQIHGSSFESDKQQLESHHANIFKHLTHGCSFLDQNWEPIPHVGPQLSTTAYLFNHQFTELPTTASISGSIASDIMLKFALDQYSLVESTVIFDGLHSRGGVLFM